MKNILKKIKETYSTDNPNLINLLKKEDFINIGYSENILEDYEYLIEFAFPVVYPFPPFLDFKGKSILDLGSGAGLDSIVALRKGAYRVISFDISISFLKLFNLEGILKINGTMPILPFKINSFDVVIMNGSFNLVIDKTALLKELNVILKKDGYLIIGDLFWKNITNRDIYRDDPDAWSWCVAGGLTENELFNMVNQYNFKVVDKFFYEQIENLERIRYILKNE